MKVHLSEIVELRGDAWDEKRLSTLKQMNPEGRVAVKDDKDQVFIVPIGKLELIPEGR